MGVMTRLLLLLWVGVTASTVVDLQKRIIGGRDCGPAERLYHVKLIGSSGTDENHCGGSLISNQWILTAAHCLIPGWTITAYLGGHPNPKNEVTRQITDYRNYTDDKDRIHDIMLLKLDKITDIQPVPLPDCTHPLQTGDTVEIAGYVSKTKGTKKKRGNNRADFLQCADTTIADRKAYMECLQSKDPDDYNYQQWQIYRRDGVNTSEGDSGGGVVFNGMIYGVHVFSEDDIHACGAPDGCMDVCAYMDWIVGTTGIPRPGTGHGSASVKRPATGTGSGPVSPKKSQTKVG